MNANTKSIRVHLLLTLLACTCLGVQAQNQNIIDFLNLRFGMFIHYNTGTYHQEQWAYPFHDPKDFQPSALDCDQWADAAVSAGMKYAVFTTKHHDGFCLWNSKTTSYDMGSTKYPKVDIVKEYTDAFRKKGLKVGLYFSVWDRHQGIEHGNINKINKAIMLEQLHELLTNYGEVICLVIDGWGSVWGKSPDFEELKFHEVADFVHSIQPNCLVINHSCNTSLEQTQIVHYEATHGQHCPHDNTLPSQQGPTLQPAWFWEPQFAHGKLKSVDEVVKELHFTSTHYANYLLNAAPNDKGLLDDNVIKRLNEIGQAIPKHFPTITKLPKVQMPGSNVHVTASSQAGENFAPHNVVDANLFTRWKPAKGDKTPTITLEFKQPETFNRFVTGEKGKFIQEFVVEAKVNGQWKELVHGDTMTYHYAASFPKVTAKKYRMRILKYKRPFLLCEITMLKY